MKKFLLKTGFLIAVLFFSLVNTYAQSNEELKARIEKLNKEMIKVMMDGDEEKGFSFYTSDAISMPSYDKMKIGIAELRRSHEEMKKMEMKFTNFETNTMKVWECGNQVIEIGTYKMSFTMKGMESPMDDEGKYLTIWEKQQDGSLKVKVETWNTDKMPGH